ncbi:MAG: hypothetical protein COW24_03040 [Candidatus Kerfeldbacteria bacterium CG15_BIG_FIL_POST_REV_8_21_14_020_45_12]|uniref:Uncharacterized protein n=1 Tax=Candidatus Kerfeldbacteria bacterium CG15_BIG_FIL_POST_REV_8_21_14_020_45_12 TaxID=2014247 RepID=A0A2M7H3V3_9BACT|nr:MAG: hypothetical protein COW24_03040 [Candidatus Kerfeldbacteria bacterium CG15_BIG_FIL_POST_REV_8_21_14_020_45_12]PJA93006.1 MAG: hypothetical protein CO132_05160 [Candidatus Kerfeldbacteria bacterium CG_4_9_14_3_um_filter_45_8]
MAREAQAGASSAAKVLGEPRAHLVGREGGDVASSRIADELQPAFGVGPVPGEDGEAGAEAVSDRVGKPEASVSEVVLDDGHCGGVVAVLAQDGHAEQAVPAAAGAKQVGQSPPFQPIGAQGYRCVGMLPSDDALVDGDCNRPQGADDRVRPEIAEGMG